MSSCEEVLSAKASAAAVRIAEPAESPLLPYNIELSCAAESDQPSMEFRNACTD
jgi:hypothetical protein